MLIVIKAILNSHNANVRQSVIISKRIEEVEFLLKQKSINKILSQLNKELKSIKKRQKDIASNVAFVIDSLQKLNKEDRQLIIDKFIKQFSYTYLANKYFYSEKQIQRKINKILLDHFDSTKINYSFHKKM